MIKDKKNNPPTATLDINLTIVDADVSFKNFFGEKWNRNTSIKITNLVDFDNEDDLKSSLDFIRNGTIQEHQLRGKIIDDATPVVVTVSQLETERSKWTNQIVKVSFRSLPTTANQSEHYFSQSTIEQIPARIFVVDSEYQLIIANSNITAFTDYYFDCAPIIGQIFLPKNKNRKEWKEYFDTVFGGRELVFVKKYKVGEKDYVDFVRLIPLRNKNQSIEGCIFYAFDLLSLELSGEQFVNHLNVVLQHSKLQIELDSRLRELSSNLILISQKNDLIKTIGQRLKKIAPDASPKVAQGLRRVISTINSQEIFDDNWEKLKIHFVKINPAFFSKLKARSSQMTEKDLRHCAYLKMGFNVKETAHLLGIRPKSIEMARYRIKKKLKLDPKLKLFDFIQNL
ncbi:MAG: PAS domain-containing protein [Bacteroidota bacterium]